MREEAGGGPLCVAPALCQHAMTEAVHEAVHEESKIVEERISTFGVKARGIGSQECREVLLGDGQVQRGNDKPCSESQNFSVHFAGLAPPSWDLQSVAHLLKCLKDSGNEGCPIEVGPADGVACDMRDDVQG